MRRFSIGSVLLLAVLCSCVGPFENGPGLQESSARFGEAMRWRDFAGAALFVDPAVQEEFFARFPQDDADLQVVGSRFESLDVDKEQQSAAASYVLEYYRLPSSRVKKLRWLQHWRQYRDNRLEPGLWLIQNAPPPWP